MYNLFKWTAPLEYEAEAAAFHRQNVSILIIPAELFKGPWGYYVSKICSCVIIGSGESESCL